MLWKCFPLPLNETIAGIFTGSVVITSLVPILPFLKEEFRANPPSAPAGSTAVLPGTLITCGGAGIDDPLEADLLGIVEIPYVRDGLIRLLSCRSIATWSVGWSDHSRDTQLSLGSCVAILKIRNENALPTHYGGESMSMKGIPTVLSSPIVGTPVRIQCTPFAALVSSKFDNFAVTGIISGIVQADSAPRRRSSSASGSTEAALLLTDATLLPGMDGAPIFSARDDSFLGILGPPLRATESSAIFGLVLPGKAVLDTVAEKAQTGISLSGVPRSVAASNAHNRSRLSDAIQSIVLVENGASWASGVVVSSRGYVLTNAHAVPSQRQITPQRSLRILTANRNNAELGHQYQWWLADVVHRFDELDLAILKVSIPEPAGFGGNRALPPPLLLDASSLKSYNRAVAVGFSLWHPVQTSEQQLLFSHGPMVTAGTVAKLMTGRSSNSRESPAVLVTTAAVHAGASGGAIVNPDTGRLLGLITSNTRLTNRMTSFNALEEISSQEFRVAELERRQKAVLYPHLNYSLPATVLSSIVDPLLATNEHEMAAEYWAKREDDIVSSTGIAQVWAELGDVRAEEPPVPHEGRFPAALAEMFKEHGNGTPSYTAKM